jgi:diamine N-acetyltransferase
MITLSEITKDNLKDCLKLDAGNGKKDFVANSFAIAWLSRNLAKPLIINYNEEAVGFVLLVLDESNGNLGVCYLSRFMIDKDYQRKGYGRSAMKIVCDYARHSLGCNSIRLSYSPKNIAAKLFYEDFGLSASKEIINDEIVMTLRL